MDVNKLKQERTQSNRAFTRLVNGLRKAIETKALPQRISARFEKLCESWNNVQAKHNSYVNNLSDLSALDDEEEWISALQEEFENLELEVDDYVEKATKEEQKLLAEATEKKRKEDEEQ